MEKSTFEDGQFGAVIDKATLDSVLCGDGGVAAVKRILKEISR